MDGLTSFNPDETITYDYDNNDRLLTEKLDSTDGTKDRFTVYSYGTNNMATQQTAKVIHVGLDDSGQILSTESSIYNLQGRLKSITQDGTTSNYTYNDDGIRVSQNGTIYLIDPQNHTGYAQVLEELDAATAQIVRQYTIGHSILSQKDTNGVLYLLKDGHGSTRSLLNSSGQAINGQIFTYDAFGERLDNATPLTTHLYCGEICDNTGLIYLRQRYYRPGSGTLTTLDPFVGNFYDPLSLHKHLYCHADPVNNIDPTGMFLGGFGSMLVTTWAGLSTRTKWTVGTTAAGMSTYALLVNAQSAWRRWQGSYVSVVNIYVPPRTSDPIYNKYRGYILASEHAIENRLNNINNGNIFFNLVQGELPSDRRGYSFESKTLNIALEFNDAGRALGEGTADCISIRARKIEEAITRGIEGGTITVRADELARQTYMANFILHETAHSLLSYAGLWQWGGLRDHTSDGLMEGPIFSWKNMSFNDASKEVFDYDSGTKKEIEMALGWRWAFL